MYLRVSMGLVILIIIKVEIEIRLSLSIVITSHKKIWRIELNLIVWLEEV